MSPIAPIVQTLPTSKRSDIYDLWFELFHGMEDVIGSIQITPANIPSKIMTQWEICQERFNANFA
jgi:hypothetical protein